MSKEDPPPSPSHGLFDPANILGPPPTSMAGGIPFPALAHLPSAFSLLGRQPMFPPATLFGGLGAFANPLTNPLLNPAINPAAAAYLAEVSKQFVGSLSPPASVKSSSKSTPSPTHKQRSSSSSSSSKRVTSSPCSTASSSASGHYINGRSPTPTSGHPSSTVTSKSITSSTEGSRKRKQKAPKPVAVPLNSPTTKTSPLSIPSYSRIKATLNSQKLAPAVNQSKVDNGTLSDSDSQSLVSSGSSTISDDSYLHNEYDGLKHPSKRQKLSTEEDKNNYQIPHHIDGFKKQLLADQIRQRVQIKTSDSSPNQSPKKERKTVKNPKFLSQLGEEQLAHQKEVKLKLEAELRHQKERLRLLMKEAENSVNKSQDNSAASNHSPSSSLGSPNKSVPPLKLKIPNPKLKLAPRPEENGNDVNDSLFTKQPLSDIEKAITTTSGSDDSDSDDSGGSSDDNSSNDSENTQSQDGSRGDRQDSESMDEGGTKKKRKTVTDENELRIALEHGWTRQTTIHSMGRRGIVGEVLYFAPCGKKMKTIPDVMRYLDRHTITDLTRDNFTFNTKINVGDFFEMLEGESSPVKLTELEVLERIEMSRGKRARMQANARKKRERCMKQQALAKQLLELNMKKKLEQEEIAQKDAELKFQKRLEKQKQKAELRRHQQLKFIEKQKQQEQLKVARQRDKIRKQEELRKEREMKAQQILESNLLWFQMEREREMKRQQAVILREQEKERRRQHLILLKTLENRKKQEERDKLREEKEKERKLLAERRLVQRQHEIEIARQLQRPVEDMELTDHKPFPEISRINGMSLSGAAYADCLMAVEFLHNFGDALGLDADSLLNLESLQSALLNRQDEDVQDFLSLVTHLLRFALEDPGLPNPREGITKLGQKISDIDITPTLLSEVLRIFIRCRNGGENELTKYLLDDPLEALNPTHKAKILAFLCDELVSSRTITSEIEHNIDSINNMRRDKWIVEGKLRKLRMTQVRKFHKQNNKVTGDEGESTNMSTASKRSEDDIAKLDDLEEKEIDSGHESDSTTATNHTGGNLSEEEDDISLEECEKKIEKLTKQHGNYRNKVNNASIKLRTVPYGEDRYKRQYWVLPYCGGMYIEGLESTDPECYQENVLKYKIKDEEESEKDKAEVVKEIKQEVTSEKPKEAEMNENESDAVIKSDSAEVKSENDSEIKSEKFETCETNQNVQSACNSLSNGVTPEICDKMETDSSIPKTDVSKTSDNDSEMKDSDSKESKNLSNSPDNVPSTPTTSSSTSLSSVSITTKPAEVKPSFMSIDALLKKESNTAPKDKMEEEKTENNNNLNHFLPTNIFPPSPLVTDYNFRSYSDILDNQPWFSILPRMPCDDSSLTRSSQNQQNTPSSNLSNNSLSYLSLLPISPFNVSSPMLASQLNAAPSVNNSMDLSNMSAASELTDIMNFKVPTNPSETPTSSCHGDDIKPNKPEAQPIPLEKQQGWWKVVSGEELGEIVKCLHCRGIREKELVKVLQRYVDCPNYVINTGKKNVCKSDPNKQAISDEQKELETELMNDGEKLFLQVEHECDLAALETMEALESRIYQASLQVKGWKSIAKATDDPNLELISRRKTAENKNQRHPLDIAKERLLLLESNIERRYLKPPLSKNVALNMANISNNDSRSHDHDEEEIEHDATPGLLTWRNVVAKISSPAQLVMCVNQLSTSISWEKSIMKVKCEICRKDDNEAQLLLCDGCDKGYHTYCFKPKMDIIPDGDWYCYECISKASGASHCIRCGKRIGKLVECDDCPRAFHIDCLDPPLHRLPKKWQCAACGEKKCKKGGKRGPKKKSLSLSSDKKETESTNAESPAPTPPPSVEKKKKEPPSVTRDADLILCKTILSDMEKHDEGWPFLQPVNGKQFPSYRKIIKHPMDFNTMKTKLRDNLYKSRIEFAGDAHLVFDNCVTFNEDDSEVGKAGHDMREYFQKRYTDLFPDDS